MLSVDNLFVQYVALEFNEGSIRISFSIYEHNETVNRPISRGCIIDYDPDNSQGADLIDQIKDYLRQLLAQGAKVE